MREKGVIMAVRTFQQINQEAKIKEGVRYITYEQFQELKDSSEIDILLDVRSPEDFYKGHIPDAENFPLDSMDADSIEDRLTLNDNIVVYCGGFDCPASTNATSLLTSLGYNVIDYKGGIEEWESKGNQLER